jgi:predicted aspartyl protease
MSPRGIPYDTTFVPPAPVLPLRIASPLGSDGIAIQALVDTGADASVLPASIAQRLRLPTVGLVDLVGVTGASRRAPLVAARVAFGRGSVLGRFAVLGREAIIGRDLLNGVITRLDGPAGMLFVSTGRRRA